MKKAFSFVEVIISVVILSFMGMAILNFNSFNKKAMQFHLEKQDNLLISSALLHYDKIDEKGKTYTLFDLVTFNNLDDDDRTFLNNIEITTTKVLEERMFLYTDGKKEYYINYGNINIKYNNTRPLSYIYLERD